MKPMRQTDVELQVAPMLDMAFQLLTFFILTYQVAPVEGQFSMNLLPAAPAIEMNADAPSDDQPVNPDIPASLRTLRTSLMANPDGSLDRILLGENQLSGLDDLRARLEEITADKTLPFDQAIIQSDPNLAYSELMRVIDVFAGPTVKITRISFQELDPGFDPLGPAL